MDFLLIQKNKETWLMDGNKKVEKINYVEKIVGSSGEEIFNLSEENSDE